VQELFTGEKRPLSQYEFSMWNTYYKVKALYQENAQREQERNRNSGGR
jgi:hypothetical protein